MSAPISPASRRAFLQRAAQLSLTGLASPLALQMLAMSEASAQSAKDYKALVCVFLYGGNDHINTLPPFDAATHAEYLRVRTSIATARDALAATALVPREPLPGGRQLALAPELAPLKGLFDSQQLGVLLNVGTLMQPTTKAQYNAASVPLPPKLFSHNDQQSVWQSSLPEGSISGWGGRLGDIFMAGNERASFTCVNASGNAVYMSGRQAVQYQVSSNGSVPLRGVSQALFGSSVAQSAMLKLVTAPHSHLMRAEYTRVMSRAIEANDTLSAAMATAPVLNTAFDTSSSLAMQLRMVARLISVRQALGVQRQVFFVSLGGFDLHDFLVAQHPGLLAQLASALRSFHDATTEMGVSQQVTAFTASDFGRTFSSNGDGSDHGWGSHHFVLGGAVDGGRFHGRHPELALNGPDDVGQGRLLPTTAVDQLAATLARWLGVSDSDLALVAPNIGEYSQRDLGLFRV